MSKTVILSVMYTEPEWSQTLERIERCHDFDKVFVERGGVGSLAKAYNDGFKQIPSNTDYVWFVSNVLFDPDILKRLIGKMGETGFAAIHPSFDNSDHLFCRSNGSDDVLSVPFVEFTAPIVRYDVFKNHILDEDMPYWGHDLDWGNRVRNAGYKIGVDHGCKIGHEYIRNAGSEWPDTIIRRELRKKTDGQTTRALERKYGKKWRELLRWT